MLKSIKQAAYDFFPKLLGKKASYMLRYYHNRGHFPNLRHPKDLSEILISRILKDDFAEYWPYVDKIIVRNYVKKKGLESILLKHYGYWDTVDEIDANMLPNKFVLKTNNGSGGKDIFLCRDKESFDLVGAKRALAIALNKVHEYEAQYNKIKPRIICEELIETKDDTYPTDYKFTCIHGEPVDIFIGTGREKHVKFCTKNLDWTHLDYTKKEFLPTTDPVKPQNLEYMVSVARKLSEDFDYVRVDLYENDGRVYFGELTFSPWGGIMYSYTNEAIKDYGNRLLSGYRCK